MLQGNFNFDSTSGNPAWYALYTRHQHEKAVDELLASQGFETFLPVYTAVHRWKDRTKQLSVPLFPNYIFVRGVVGNRLQILKTPGVYAFVESGGRPGIIPESEIAAIRQVVENSFLLEPHPFLATGDWVRIKSGPLSGLEGILVRKQDRLRLVLSVEMLGRSVSVEVDVCSVERVSKGVNGDVSERVHSSFGSWRHRPMVEVLSLQ
jgi:transcription antitermination factor NusG